jgi:hypothetical protein
MSILSRFEDELQRFWRIEEIRHADPEKEIQTFPKLHGGALLFSIPTLVLRGQYSGIDGQRAASH